MFCSCPQLVCGDLPLHLALRSGRTYHNGAVSAILAAAPAALEVHDSLKHLYPFQIYSSSSCLDAVLQSTGEVSAHPAPEGPARATCDTDQTNAVVTEECHLYRDCCYVRATRTLHVANGTQPYYRPTYTICGKLTGPILLNA